MTVGEKIQAVRKEKGLSQKELSENTGLAEITIRQYESNKRKPKIENNRKIALALRVPSYILTPIERNCMSENFDKKKLQMIADNYGFRKQSMMLIEECSELQKAICKWHRKHGDYLRSESSECDERTDIIDELADVIIMAKQITYLLSAEDEVSEQIVFKLDRQLRRMEEENVD